jgi:hypothetical protein
MQTRVKIIKVIPAGMTEARTPTVRSYLTPQALLQVFACAVLRWWELQLEFILNVGRKHQVRNGELAEA